MKPGEVKPGQQVLWTLRREYGPAEVMSVLERGSRVNLQYPEIPALTPNCRRIVYVNELELCTDKIYFVYPGDEVVWRGVRYVVDSITRDRRQVDLKHLNVKDTFSRNVGIDHVTPVHYRGAPFQVLDKVTCPLRRELNAGSVVWVGYVLNWVADVIFPDAIDPVRISCAELVLVSEEETVWFWAEDEEAECWNGPYTREQAIREGQASRHGKDFFIADGTLQPKDPIFESLKVVDLIEAMNQFAADNQLADDSGGNDAIDELPQEKLQQAEAELHAWAKKHLTVNDYYLVEGTRDRISPQRESPAPSETPKPKVRDEEIDFESELSDINTALLELGFSDDEVTARGGIVACIQKLARDRQRLKELQELIERNDP